MNKKNTKKQKNKKAGYIKSIFSGVAKVVGLEGVFLHEVLNDEKNQAVGLVVGFSENDTDVLFFNNNIDIKKPIFRSKKFFSVSFTDKYIGRVVDGAGRPLDGLGEIKSSVDCPVFQPAPPIISRRPVKKPLITGIKIIDTNLPIGRGQRELIIGDRNLGKSTLAIDTVLNQKNIDDPVYCIYVLIGEKKEKFHDLVALFEKHNAFLYSTIVFAAADSSFAEQYLAPFVGCTIAEYFMKNGKDALIVYDDLTKHAKVYRDISLILERAPGREAYPGDIFSLHAGLLERSACLSEDIGGGSMTALPIIETLEGDITSFIPTNIISITDGQIYLERGLFQKGFIPAVNIGLSVSRIGSQAQPDILEKVVGGIRITLSHYKELQKLSQLETTISKEARKKIYRGDLILELLKQYKRTNVTWPEQVVLFYIVEEGFFDDLSNELWRDFEHLMLDLLRTKYFSVLNRIKNGEWNYRIKKKIKDIVIDFKQEFLYDK